MFTVACVLRSGGVYDREWVRKLAAGVVAHTAAPHRFVCLTDTALGLESVAEVPLWHDWPRWWAKMELWREAFARPVLYLDLDTVIVGDVAPLVRTTPGFTMVADFGRREMMNSCAMSWLGDFGFLYDQFRARAELVMAERDAMKGPRVGDQSLIHDTLEQEGKDIDTFPADKVVSFKMKARAKPPAGAAVVAFHGRPKPDSRDAGWAHKQWAAL